MIETTMRMPVRRWQQVRQRLHDLIWPTDEEAREYHRILLSLEREAWLRRGQADATRPQKRHNPPHHACPCELCGRYWQGFWTHL